MILQKSHSGMSRYQQDLPYRTVSGTVRWALCCLLVVLLCYCFMQPTLLFADSPLVTQEVRYHMPGAGEVFLIWGINGWAVVPEENRPAGTVVKDAVMHTPMVREGDTFVAQVQVLANATMDYGFLITKTRSGAAVYIWEANGEQDYHTIAAQDGVIEVQTTLTLAQDQALASVANALLVTQEIRYHMPEAGEVFLIWGINGWAVVPEENRPAGTVVKDDVMHTPMVREGDTFVAKVQVPSAATIDYGFLITKQRNGAAIEAVWDGKQDYQMIVAEDGIVEVKATLTLAQAWELPGILNIGLYLLIGICIVLGIGIIIKRLQLSKQRIKRISFYIIMFALETAVILLLLRFSPLWGGNEPVPGLPDYDYVVQFDPTREGGHLRPNLNMLVQGERRNQAVGFITNSKGFRNRKEFSYTVPQGTYRILFLGDSFVDGMRTDQMHTIGYVLEDYLRRHNGESRYSEFEVMISGHNNPARAWYNYQEHGFKYQPHLVILGVTLGNDLTWHDYKHIVMPQRAADGSIRLTLDEPGVHPTRSKNDLLLPPQAFRKEVRSQWIDDLELKIRGFLEDRFYSFGYLMPQPTWPHRSSRGRVYAADVSLSLGLFYQPLLPEFEQFYADFEEVLVGFSQAVKMHDTRFLVVLFPVRIQVSDEDWDLTRRFYGLKEETFDLDYPNKRIARLCAAHEIVCLDLTPAYRDYERTQGIRFYRPRGDMHINEAGQALSGREIGKYILGVVNR